MNNILISQKNHIGLITLHRPKVLNALSAELMHELSLALETFDNDDEIRVIIITGNKKAFAAGADIQELSTSTPVEHLKRPLLKDWAKIAAIKKPIIAAVDGYALGGGAELAMACDFIVASDPAIFSQPEIKIGTMPGAGGTQRLTHAIHKSKAMMYLMTGMEITAKEAFEWGLVAKVVHSECLMAETQLIAEKIASHSPIAIRLIKESVNKSFESHLSSALDFERKNFYLTFATKDQKEGMNAFLQKRSASYTGE